MRLLHVNDHLDWVGGLESYLLTLIPRLEARGYHQGAVYGQRRGFEMQEAWHEPMVSDPSPAARRSVRPRMESILASFQPDLVQVHNLYNVGVLEACVDAAPTAIFVHDYRHLCPASSFFYRNGGQICERTCSLACLPIGAARRCLTPRTPRNYWYYQRVRWVMDNQHRIAAFIANSDYVGERLRAAGIDEHRIHVIPYYTTVDPVDALPTPPAQPTVLFLGRMTRYKGCDHFVDVLSRLPGNVRGVMVGSLDANSERHLTELAAARGCRDRLELRGWASRAEIASLMQASTVVLFPSVYPEAMGLVGVEAMANGVPVVSFRVGGTGQWLIDGETGFFAEVNDVAAMADATQRLLEDPELHQRFAAAGLDRVRTEFLPEVHLGRLTALFEEIRR